MGQLLSNYSFDKFNIIKITGVLLLNILIFSSSKAIPPDLSIIPSANNTVYVDKNATGDGSGSSWTDAVPDLATALKWASLNYNSNWETIPLKIFVAKGVYEPAFSPIDGDDFGDAGRNNTFLLINNVHIYGGFDPENGIVSLSNTRLLQSAGNSEGSILSGNVGDKNSDDDNSYHVVISSGLANNAILDGFGVTEGKSYEEISFTANGNLIFDCSGAGIYASASSPTLRNLYIYNNHVGESGGGYFGYQSSPTFVNVVFEHNSAQHGGAMANQSTSNPLVINSKFSNNSADQSIYGNAIYNVQGAMPTFINITVVDGNYAIINDNGAVATINNSIVWGGIGGSSTFVANYSLIEGETSTANGNVDASGLTPELIFANPTNLDFKLKLSSPAVNSGSNTLFNSLVGGNIDLAYNSRINGVSIDLGAYEYHDGTLPIDLLSFDGNANTQGNLLKWNTADEQNFSGFEIERAVSDQFFSKIGYLSGKGAGSYQFLDKYAVEGINYYRLKQIDKDGSFAYSKIVAIDFSLNGGELLIYPIPAKNELNLVNAEGQLNIINTSGQVLKTLKIAGDMNTSVNISNVASGVYTLQFVKTNGEMVIKKILVDKNRR
jgi:hypothetical protein